MNNNNLVWGVIVVILVVIGAAWWVKKSPDANMPLPENNTTINNSTSTTNNITPGGTMIASTTLNINVVSPVKEFSVTGGSNFRFTPSQITVNKGDTVRINFTSQGGTHDWVLDEFGAATNVLQSGQSQSIQFVATRSGQFQYYCSVDGHRAMGMVGTLTVQ